ncbi:hypothetical protein [Alkalihalobacillus sp. LMS39]|uniref:hypothetical protein n=1 Tax=Alkalihalobacillus sp. LMS39 TaxID=2924032 RepID=UPI001FB4C45D|nr:hypothetical protein [Alkalihalobacillus sp. LMS39]UOE95942.1 hypothetical protein MM271_10220 [Alkalihalobacillus sp. LMS39]
MTKLHLKSFILIAFIFTAGFVFGLLLDKEWLSEQENAYVSKIKAENQMLHYEREHWLSFIGEQLQAVPVYVASEQKDDRHLQQLFQQIGVEPLQLEPLESLFAHEGIVVSIGHEMTEYEFPHLVLDTVPDEHPDIFQFYLSLLKLKGETIHDEN